MNNVKSNSFFGNSVLVFSSITRFCKFLYANRISHVQEFYIRTRLV